MFFRTASQLKTYDTYVFAREELHVARVPADGGVREGSVVTACIGDDVYTYRMEDGECHKWNTTMTSPAMEAGAECRVTRHGPPLRESEYLPTVRPRTKCAGQAPWRSTPWNGALRDGLAPGRSARFDPAGRSRTRRHGGRRTL